MTKKEIYRLRDILFALRHNKQADTDKTETHDKFCLLQEEGIKICEKTLWKMKPLKKNI